MICRHNTTKIDIVWLTLGIMLLIVFARLGLNINIPVKLLLAIAVLPALFGSSSQFLAMAMTFIPLATTFQYKYALLIYIFIGFIRFRHLISISRVIPIIILMMIWELAHSFDGIFSFVEYMRGFAELLFLGFITSIKWKEIDYRLIARALALSTIGVSLLIIYIQINSGLDGLMDMLSQSATEYRFGQNTIGDGMSSYGLNYNANQLGFICNMSIASLLVLFARKEYTILDVVMLLGLVFFGTLTLSRTFVIIAAFLFTFYILLSPGSVSQKTKNLLCLLILASIFILGISKFAPSILDNFAARNDVDDITNGRGFLLKFYHNHIFSSFKYCFWGIGLQGYGSEIRSIYGHHIMVCHNSIQEIWVTWGFVGVVMFALMISYMISVSRKWAGRRTFFAFIPLCSLLLSSMAGQLVSSGSSMLALSMVYIIMCLKWNNIIDRYGYK